MMSDNLDSFFAQYFPTAPRPPQVPFALQKGDRLLLIGDSITEARRFSVMLETYLAVCVPGLQIEVRNIGKGGETATQFLERIQSYCLDYKPTAATICYGMNDAGYVNANRQAADQFFVSMTQIVKMLKAAGTRLVLSSPGCVGRVPPWQFVLDANGTLDGINTSLMYIRDEAAAIATAEQLLFVDHFWNLYQARYTAAEKHGVDYAVCGRDDGVHPSWAGHVVMAYGFFKALGFDGNLGNFHIDLATKSAATNDGHVFKGELENRYTFTSSCYAFCAGGLPDKDWSIRSGMTLVPFNQEFNRFSLIVTGTSAPRYRVSWINQYNWLEEWHIYTSEELTRGINLAEDFHTNPFSVQFNRINDLVFQKQTIEASETWRGYEWEGKLPDKELAEYEVLRADLLNIIKQNFVPITHFIHFEALS